jgi:hypothetical protein
VSSPPAEEPSAAPAPRSEGASAGGAHPTLQAWLAEREPAVPAALLIELGGERAAVAPGSLCETLAAEARSALADVRTGAGERRGAFRLLAADAYLTWASEVALASDDPAAALLRIVQEVVNEAEAG